MIDDDLRELASGRNFAALTTLLPDGHPATQPMWVDVDGDHLVLNTEVHRRKFASIERDPRVTVMIWELGNPYRYREVRGRVVEVVHGPAARDHIDRLAQLYFDRDYDPDQITSERVMLRVAPLDA